MKVRKALKWAGLIAVIGWPQWHLYAQQRYELTVEQAVELAFKNVVSLKNKQLDYRIQEAMNKEITGQAMPQLTGNAGAQYYYKLPIFLFPDGTSTAVYTILKDEGVQGSSGPITEVPDPELRPVSFQQPWNGSAGATLTQLLFQPDVFVGLQARATSMELAQQNIEVEKINIKDSAYKRYYAVLIAEKQLEFLNDGIERIKKLLHDNEVMYRNGFVEKLDIDRTQVQLSNLTTTRNTLRNGITLSYAALKFALGLSQKDTLQLTDTLSIAEIKEGILDNTFSLEDRQEYKLLQTSKKLQLLDLKRYKMQYIPTVSLMANYARQGQAENFILTDKDAFWYSTGYIGLNIDIPLFDGFQRKNKVVQASLKAQQLDNNIDNLEKAIELEQTVSKESLKNAVLNLDEQQKNIKLAQDVYNTTKRKFEQGLGSSFELIQAENDLQTSQSNYFQALYDAIVAKVSYQKALGKL